MSVLMILISVLAVLLGAFLYWFKQRLNYWENLGVKGPKPELIFGNLRKVLLLQRSIDMFLNDLYNNYKDEKVVGFYKGHEPGLLIRDPNIIKHVMIKDFNSFTDRVVQVDKINDINQHLFNLEGAKWKVLRQNFTSLFTSGKLKKMSPLIENITVDLERYIDKRLVPSKTIEIRDLTGKFTIESIGSCAFGLDMKTFDDSENFFQTNANKVLRQSKLDKIIQILSTFIPSVASLINIPYIDSRKANQTKEFFNSFVSVILREREGKPKVRHDLMDLMIELKERGPIERKGDENLPPLTLTDNLIIAQAFVFFFGGFETSASTVAFLLYELSFNQEVQEKAHREVCEIYNRNGKIQYDDLKDLTYVTACFEETLRKYPIVTNLTRIANTDYTIPDLGITIKKDIQTFIPVWSIQKDEKHFENPEVFDPERFMPENRSKIPSCVYNPFGDGPRNCIGMRFAKVQSLYALTVLLRKYKFTPSSKTPSTITYDTFSPLLAPVGGIWLDITTRDGQ